MNENRPQNPAEFLLLLNVFAKLTTAKLLLPRRPLDRLTRSMHAQSRAASPDHDRMHRVRRFTDALCWKLPYLTDKRCLPRSLALYHFATRFGFPVRLHCGVRKAAGNTLDGHAWLSLDGEPFMETDDRANAYTITLTYPDDADAPQRETQEQP